MKILNFVINEYFAPEFNEVRKSEDCKALPIFKQVPKDYFGFYFLKVLFDGKDLYQLKQRLID